MATVESDRRPVIVVEAPAHPVQQLQGPFEESMFESQSEQQDDFEVPLDAASRRELLLDAPTYSRVIAGRWKQKKGEKYHPLWKLVAQMSFGIHLLVHSMAKSQEDVFQILQTHVDEIDMFLERTTEDFTLAQEDIQERLKCLKLPLQHPEVFDRMLEDRTFRNSIVEGNEKIEHIVTRTGCAMKDALKDVQKGFDSTSALERYLRDLETDWIRTTHEHEAVFVAMLGNVEGWRKAFLDLHMQGNKLASYLRKLTDVINQMQQRAGEVSRRLIRQQQKQGGNISGSNITYISHQPSDSRSSIRQQNTSSPSKTRKPLPAPTSRSSTRQHSRNPSTESAQAQRTGTSQSQRSGTSQSARSGNRTETPSSRTDSRNDMMSLSAQDNFQHKNTRHNSPRVVYVTSHLAQHSQSASIHQQITSTQPISEESDFTNNDPRHPDRLRLRMDAPQNSLTSTDKDQPPPPVSRNFAPVELPAELPPSAFLQAPMSSTNRLSSGLGILPSQRRAQAQAQAKGFNSTTALIELLADPSRYSRVPLTPNSARSSEAALKALEGQQKLVIETRQQDALQEPTPDQTSPNPKDALSAEDPPYQASWSSRPLDTAGRTRSMAEKIAVSNDEPEEPVPSIPRGLLAQSAAQPVLPRLQTSRNVSADRSGRVTPAPETAASDTAVSELSTGFEHEIGNLSRQISIETIASSKAPDTSVTKRKKLSFIAELVGSEPVLLPSTVYAPVSAEVEAPAAFELEAPQIYFNLPPRPTDIEQSAASVSEPSELQEGQSLRQDETPSSLAKDAHQIDMQFEASIYMAMAMAGSPKQESAFSQARHTPANNPFSDQHETSEVLPDQFMPAKVEDMIDIIHDPSFRQPGSPSIKQQDSTTTKCPATLDEPQNQVKQLGSTVENIPHPIPEKSSTDFTELTSVEKPIIIIRSNMKASSNLPPILELETRTESTSTSDVVTRANPSALVVPADSEEPKSASYGHSPDKPKDLPAIPSSPTSTKSKPSFHLSLNITTKSPPQDQEPKFKTSPVLTRSPPTPPAVDLARSNTKESRQKWRAFFGQRKSPLLGGGRASAASKSPTPPLLPLPSPSTSSLRSASSKKSLKSVTFSENLSSPTLTLNGGKFDHGEKLTRVMSPLVNGDGFGVGYQMHVPTNGNDGDQHSIFDEYV